MLGCWLSWRRGTVQAEDDPVMKHKPYIPDDANPEQFLNELYELYDTAAFERLTDGEGKRSISRGN